MDDIKMDLAEIGWGGVIWNTIGNGGLLYRL
jgi:hypothetical protein